MGSFIGAGTEIHAWLAFLTGFSSPDYSPSASNTLSWSQQLFLGNSAEIFVGFGVLLCLPWMHHEILFPGALCGGRQGGGETRKAKLCPQVALWPGDGCAETLVLSFLIGALRKLGYLISKAPSNSGIGWFWETGARSWVGHWITRSRPYASAPLSPSQIQQLFIKSWLGAGHCARCLNSVFHTCPISATCKNISFLVRILGRKIFQVPLPSGLFLESSGTASLTCSNL